MKHANIALFVPHNGCPHQCSFCNQNSITGKAAQPSAQDVTDACELAVNTLGPAAKEAEIAFFGGSFTAISKEYMCKLLSAAYPYVKTGRVRGVRISTRPDCISRPILKLLKAYGVTSVELGAQSMIDGVLTANGRGHTAQDVVSASGLIKEYGFSLGLQMMTGLYQSTPQLDKETANAIISLSPDSVRIYPTVTMKGTPLENLYINGEYAPPTLDETVALCAELLTLFEGAGIPVIRLGLHDSESLKKDRLAGPYHPALRELCESRRLLDDIITQIGEKGIPKGSLLLKVHPKTVSKLCGQKRCNIERLRELGFDALVQQDQSVPDGIVTAEKK